jgi:hypothetical protein
MKVFLSSENIVEPPVTIDKIRTLLVRDSFDNPIFLAIQQTPENVWVVTPDDPKFNDLIEELGISKRISLQFATLNSR